MNFEEFTNLLAAIMKSLHGHNYEVTLGARRFTSCNTLADVAQNLKLVFPKAEPNMLDFTLVTMEELQNEIQETFKYRGDYAAGLELDNEKESELNLLTEKYFDYILNFAQGKAMLYSYKSDSGIPGYPVWWHYRYLLLREDGIAIFLYGSASD